MSEKPPFITVTGADERTDLAALAKLDAEIGLLYTETPEGRNRYPRWDWIREASLEIRRASLHICGRGARAKLMDGKLAVSGFQRIQVNGLLECAEVEQLCLLYPRHTIVTQFHYDNRHLLVVCAPNHALLIDGSGGRGKSPDTWNRPTTTKHVGFAGGLGPDNILEEIPKIQSIAHPGWWVDMEGKLRVNDWFSVERAAECIDAFHAFIPQPWIRLKHPSPWATCSVAQGAISASPSAKTISKTTTATDTRNIMNE
jgi:phosphoribosylanthranilate isomerase